MQRRAVNRISTNKDFLCIVYVCPQLVEGERKAVFEDCEREKEENKDKIRKLAEEIKLMKQEVSEGAWDVDVFLTNILVELLIIIYAFIRRETRR